MVTRDDVTIPNVITVARILIAPLIAVLLASDPAGWGLVAIAVGLTDVLDGWLARLYKWETEAGRILDPVADVVYTSAIAISLAVAGVLPIILLAATLAQKFLKSLIAALATIHLKGVKTHVTDFGKIVELITNLGVAVFILSELIADPALYELGRIAASLLTTAGISFGFVNAWKINQQYQQLKDRQS